MAFSGFPRGSTRFFTDLVKNNKKEWFDKHRDEFDSQVMMPAREFVYEMGERLKKIAPKVQADPRVNKSIFRINRDTRFSKDKSPYKTHLGILFWEGERSKMECPGFYFHLEPGSLMLGGGLYMFAKSQLEPYRESVVDKKHGPALARAVAALDDKGYDIGGVHYKRVPRGYDPDHPLAALLLHNGLYAGTETRIPKELFTPGIINYCLKVYKGMLPLHRWLVDLTRRT